MIRMHGNTELEIYPVGTVGVGLFVYMIANAYHWMLEVNCRIS